MSDDDVRDAGSLFSAGPVVALPKPIPEVAGAYFMVTGTGRFMRNVSIDPEHNFGIIRIDDKGTGYQILWGLVGEDPHPNFRPICSTMRFVPRRRTENAR